MTVSVYKMQNLVLTLITLGKTKFLKCSSRKTHARKLLSLVVYDTKRVMLSV